MSDDGNEKGKLSFSLHTIHIDKYEQTFYYLTIIRFTKAQPPDFN